MTFFYSTFLFGRACRDSRSFSGFDGLKASPGIESRLIVNGRLIAFISLEEVDAGGLKSNITPLVPLDDVLKPPCIKLPFLYPLEDYNLADSYSDNLFVLILTWFRLYF